MFNMDFTKPVVIKTAEMDWEASPMAGVKRKRLSFEEVEKGHATSIVEFEAGSSFRHHEHPLGEEILVLDGVFSDETGDYPAGTYFRNAEGFSHAPYSDEGCKLFVKLHQFDPEDLSQVRIDTKNTPFSPGQGNLRVLPLHQYGTESTALVWWPAGEKFVLHRHMGGEEIYVISGEFIDENGRYPTGTWIRSPHMSTHHPFVEEDTLIFVKTGHL
ncbi:MAG: cupin domain-containing protein [Arenicellales bacterium]